MEPLSRSPSPLCPWLAYQQQPKPVYQNQCCAGTFSCCLSPWFYSVQSITIWTVERSHIRPDSWLADKQNLLFPPLDPLGLKHVHSRYHQCPSWVSTPLPQHVSQSLLSPSCLCFLCVMMILKVFLRTLFSKNQLVARYQHQSVPTVLYLTHTEAFHSCSRTLLSLRLISGLPAWHFISDPIFTAPLSLSQETDSSQMKQFL